MGRGGLWISRFEVLEVHSICIKRGRFGLQRMARWLLLGMHTMAYGFWMSIAAVLRDIKVLTDVHFQATC